MDSSTSPFRRLVVNASSVHALITTSEPDELREEILSILARNHGVKHVSQRDIEREIYNEWKVAHPDIHLQLVSMEKRVNEIAAPPPIRSLYMDIGVREELNALKVLEQDLNKNVVGGDWIVAEDQRLRTLSVGENIELRGRFDALIQRESSDGKRVNKGIVEVKTRVCGFRENPADLTQLSIYSRMVNGNPSKLVYILLEYDPSDKSMRKTPFSYEQLTEHWENVVYPNLRKLYPVICAEWSSRMIPNDPNYIGRRYFNRVKALIEKVLVILRVPDLNGDVTLIEILETSKKEIEKNMVASYAAFCSVLTPTIVRRVRDRDLTFFSENIYDLLYIDTKTQYGDYVLKYSNYVVGIMRDNVTDKTRESLWKLIEDVIATA